MYERFTDRSRKVMQLANQEASRFNHEYIGTEHILLGLIKEGEGTACKFLEHGGVSLDSVRIAIEALMISGISMVPIGKLRQTPRAKKAIECAIEAASTRNHSHVGTEHLLAGLVMEGQGVAFTVLSQAGIDRVVMDNLLDAIKHVPMAVSEDVKSEKGFVWVGMFQWDSYSVAPTKFKIGDVVKLKGSDGSPAMTIVATAGDLLKISFWCFQQRVFKFELFPADALIPVDQPPPQE